MAEEERQRNAVLEPIKFAADSQVAQTESLLFSVPGEIRDVIFGFVFEQYEDKSRQYTSDTYYTRPDYQAPRRTDTALLRTCQQAYHEAWFQPWALAEHVFFFTNDDQNRRPRGLANASTSIESMARTLRNIHALLPESKRDVSEAAMKIDSVRIFPQLCELEPGNILGDLFNMPYFYPVRLTITLRHSDWWHWEYDAPLRADGAFVARCAFPSSVRELRFELETTERRSQQLNRVAELMASTWKFKRQDGARLIAPVKTTTAAEADGDISRWQGTSILDGQRWLEDETAPETLSYYVRTLVFTPVDEPKAQDVRTPLPAFDADVQYPPNSLEVGGSREFGHQWLPHRSVHVRELEAAGIEPGTPATTVRERLAVWRQEQLQLGTQHGRRLLGGPFRRRAGPPPT